MDFVNKAYAQTLELFRSLSPGTRVVAGLLLVGIADRDRSGVRPRGP
jgi:hypothetical protein